MLLHNWIIFLTSGTLYGIFRMSSVFINCRNRTVKSYYNTTIKRKCVTLSNFRFLFSAFFLFQLLNKINIHKSRFENLKEVNISQFFCLHPIMSMELVEKIELLRRLATYASSKIHLDRYQSFRKILLIVSWDINFNPAPVHGTQNKNMLHLPPFHDCNFIGDWFFFNLNSLKKM